MPDPAPGPRYESVPEDLCDRLEVDKIATQHGLVVSPWYEPTSRHLAESGFWYTSCGFSTQADDERFETEFGEFQPNGLVNVTVYGDLGEARDDYRMMSHNYVDRWGAEPNATSAPMAGWWDEGVFLERITVVDEEDYTLGELDANRLDVSHLISHGNLIVEVNADALSPTGDIDAAQSVLHSLADALIEEAVGHLTLATAAPAT
jgi:hypothetical protein